MLIFLLGCFLLIHTPESYAQDNPAKAKKTRIRSSKRKGEKARRNPRVRETRFKMRTRKGDRSVNRDLTGRRVQRNKRSKGPQKNYANYKPASRRTQYRSKSGRVSSPKRIRTASAKGERSRGGDISGRKIRTTRSPNRSGLRFNYTARNPNVVKRGKPREGRKTYRSTYVRSVSNQRKPAIANRSTTKRNVARKKKPSEGRNRYSSPNIRSRTSNDARKRNSITGRKSKSPRSRTGSTSVSGRSNRSPRTTTGSSSTARRTSVGSGGVRSTRTAPGNRAKSFKQNRAKSVSGNIRNKRPSNPYAAANTRRSRKGDKPRNRDITGRRLKENKRSPQKQITINAPNPYRKRKERGESSVSNRGQIAKSARSIKPGSRFSRNTFGGVRTSTRSGETASNRSASGKKIRTRNMKSRRPLFGTPSYPGYLTGTKRGEGGFSGKSARVRSSSRPGERAGVQFGGFRTATAKGERSTNRDIAGKRIRTRNKESRTTRIVGLPQKRRLSISAAAGNNRGKALEGRPPGKGTRRGGTFSGNVRSKRTPKGGGSITRLRNNNGKALAKAKPGRGTIMGGTFSGSIRAGRGTGPGKGPKYSGNVRSKRTPKGGGSITRLRNNNGKALARTRPGRDAIRGGRFSGNARNQRGWNTNERSYEIRTQLDERLHNNKGKPIGGRMVGRGTIQGATFSGNLRKKTIGQARGTTYNGRIAKRSLKPSRSSIAGSKYRGNLRKGPLSKPGRGTIQGGNFKGNLRTRKGFYTTERTYAIQTQRDERLHNNKGNPLDGRKVGRGTVIGATYKGNLRLKRNLKPGKGTIAGYKNRGDMRARRDNKPGKGTIAGYRNRGDLRARRNLKPGKGTIAGYKNRGDLRLPRSDKPGKGTISGYRYRGDMRLAKGNKHQKAGDALKSTRSWYQIGALRAHKYSGNYRYRPVSRKGQHISSSFTGFNPGNAKKENERFFKFKIWFARIFRNETPRHMKKRGRKPRYDKGESEIWH